MAVPPQEPGPALLPAEVPQPEQEPPRAQEPPRGAVPEPERVLEPERVRAPDQVLAPERPRVAADRPETPPLKTDPTPEAHRASPQPLPRTPRAETESDKPWRKDRADSARRLARPCLLPGEPALLPNRDRCFSVAPPK